MFCFICLIKFIYILLAAGGYTESDSKFGNLAKPAPQFFARLSRPCVEHMADGDE